MKHSFNILFSPNFLNNSFNFKKVLTLTTETATVEDIVIGCLEQGFLNPSIQYMLIVNGVETDDLNLILKPQDEIILKIRPQKSKLKGILRFILPLVLGNVFAGFFAKAMYGQKLAALKGFKLGVANLLGTFSAAIVTNKLIPPPQQDIGGRANNQTKDTPLYTITSTQNQANPYGPVPVIYGRIRLYPPYAIKPYTEINGKDQYIYGVLGVGFVPDGDDTRLIIEDVRIGDTAIGNYQGVSLNVVTSVQRMEPKARAKYNAAVNEEQLEIVLRQADSWVTRTTPENTDVISFDLIAGNGLIRYDLQGNSFPVTITFEAQIKKTSDDDTHWVNAELKRLTEVFEDSYIDFSATGTYIGSFLVISGGGNLFPDEADPLNSLAIGYDNLKTLNYGFRAIYDLYSGKLLIPSKNIEQIPMPASTVSNDYLRSWNFKAGTPFPQISAAGSFLTQNLNFISGPSGSNYNIVYHYSYGTQNQLFCFVTRTSDRTMWVYKVNTTTGALESVGSTSAFSFLSTSPAYEWKSTSFADAAGYSTLYPITGQGIYIDRDYGVRFTQNPNSDIPLGPVIVTVVTLDLFEGFSNAVFDGSIDFTQVVSEETISINLGLETLVDHHSVVITYDGSQFNELLYAAKGLMFTCNNVPNITEAIVKPCDTLGIRTFTFFKQLYGGGGRVDTQPIITLKPFKSSTRVRFFIHPRVAPSSNVFERAYYAQNNCKSVFITCTDQDPESATFNRTLIYQIDTISLALTLVGAGPSGPQFDELFNVGLHAEELYTAFIPNRAVFNNTSNSRFNVWASNTIVLDEDEKDPLTYNLSGKSSQPVRWSFYIDPSESDQFDIRIRRITPDTDDDKIRDELGWSTLRSFSEQEAILSQNIKTLAFRLKATEQLAGSVNSLNCMASSVLRVWNSGTFTYEETNNPAWILADVLTGKASKKPISDNLINWPQLKEWADFCDEQGFTCNAVIDNYTTQLTQLQDIAATGRASYDVIDGLHTVVIDKERTAPVQLFTPRNSWGFNSERTFVEKPHAIRVGFRNEDKDFDRDERIVYNDGYTASNATVFETLDLWGVTNSDQIYKLTRYYMAVAQLRPEVIRFTADIEMIQLTKGDLFLYQDDVIKWGLGSTRILDKQVDSGNDLIVLEGTLDLDITEDYACRVRGEDMVIYSFTVTPYTYLAGTGDIRTTSAVKVVAGAGYGSIQVGNLLAFGEVSPGAAVELIVTQIEPNQDLSAEITAIEYAPAVFNADSEEIPPFDSKITETLTARRSEPVAPEIVEIVSDESALYSNESGGLVPGIRIRFKPEPRNAPNSPYGVRAAWRDIQDQSGQWNFMTFELDSDSQILLIDVVEGQEYWGSFQYITREGVTGAYTSESNLFEAGFFKTKPHKVVGKSNPPSNITGFTSFFRNYSIALTWDKANDRDIDYYEIRLKNLDGWGYQNQKFSPLDPLQYDPYFTSFTPESLSMSSDGTKLVTGNPRKFYSVQALAWLEAGVVKTFAPYSSGPNTIWRRNIADLYPPVNDTSNFLHFGKSVSLNSDGTILVVLASTRTDATENRIYTYDLVEQGDGSWWSLRGVPWDYGSPIASVAISGDGQVLAVGKPASGSGDGEVETYDWDSGDEEWDLRIDLPTPSFSSVTGIKFGTSVALNSDGTVLVVGAPELDDDETNQGGVFTFDWDSGDEEWTQRNVLLVSTPAGGEFFGTNIALNPAANRLAVSAPFEDSPNGVVRVYRLDSTLWVIQPDEFSSQSANTLYFGSGGVTLNSNGSTVAVATKSRNLANFGIQFLTYGDWESATLVTKDKTTTYVDNTRSVGTFTYLIKGVDTSGNESIDYDEVEVTVLAPNAPTVSYNFDNLGNAILEWSVVQTTFFVSEFEIRVGTTSDTWDSADFLVTTKARKYSERINYGGTKRYFFKTIDIAENFSTDTSYVDVIVLDPPDVTDLAAQAIRSQVILTWLSAQSSLPIRYFNVYKGTSVGSGTKISSVDATISQITETEPSNPVYRYWVTAVDTAGNESSGTMVEVAVSPQSDYTFLGEVTSDMWFPDDSTFYFRTLLSGTRVGFPMIDETETYEDHFLNEGYSTPQDQIDDGFIYYLEPANLDAQYIETLDMLHGVAQEDAVIVNGTVVLNNSPVGYERVTVDNSMQELVVLRAGRINTGENIKNSGTYAYAYSIDNKVTRVPKSDLDGTKIPDNGDFVSGRTPAGVRICRVVGQDGTYIYFTKESKDYSTEFSMSPSGGSEASDLIRYTLVWTTVANQQYNIYATNFRFIQVEYNWVNPPNTGDTLSYYKGLALGTSAEPLDDGGIAAILSTDVGGTFITYNQAFLQVTSVTGNAMSTSQPYFLTFDFDSGDLNPTGFYVYGWDTSGNRVSIDISWRARGV